MKENWVVEFERIERRRNIVATLIGIPLFIVTCVIVCLIVSWCQAHLALAKQIGTVVGGILLAASLILPICWFLGTGFIMFVWEATWCENFRNWLVKKWENRKNARAAKKDKNSTAGNR